MLWQRLEIGLVVLDIVERRVVQVNGRGAELLGQVDIALEYDALQRTFMPDVLSNPPDMGTRKQKTLIRGQQMLGFTAYPISAQFVVILSQDITERKRLEAIAEAANLMESIGYVFSGIRHELGNPVNSIKVTLSVLRRNLGTFSQDTVSEYVDRVASEVARVEYLLAGLRSFSMFESVRPTHVHLPDLLDRFRTIAAADVAARSVTLSISLADDAVWVKTDPRALQQVLLNLLTNSLDALAANAQPRIVISSMAQDSVVTLAIADNGRGMSARQLEDAFKPFHTTKPAGNGLGLVIARKMLAAMGGSIELHSEEGKGTRATITLPKGEAVEVQASRRMGSER